MKKTKRGHCRGDQTTKTSVAASCRMEWSIVSKATERSIRVSQSEPIEMLQWIALWCVQFDVTWATLSNQRMTPNSVPHTCLMLLSSSFSSRENCSAVPTGWKLLCRSATWMLHVEPLLFLLLLLVLHGRAGESIVCRRSKTMHT